MYNLKLSDQAKLRLTPKAQAKGVDLATYLKDLIAFAESIDDLTTDKSRIVIQNSKYSPATEILVPVGMLKHGHG